MIKGDLLIDWSIYLSPVYKTSDEHKETFKNKKVNYLVLTKGIEFILRCFTNI